MWKFDFSQDFKESYQKLQNLLYNLLDKNYLLFSDIVETNTQ